MTAENTNQQSFTVSVVGESTGTTYFGDFVLIRHLSSRQHFLQDQLYKQYLGENPQFSSPFARDRAEILSEINAYCAKFPEFWSKDGNGVDIVDNNVIVEVYKEMQKIYKTISEQRAAKVSAAAQKLRETAANAEKSPEAK